MSFFVQQKFVFYFKERARLAEEAINKFTDSRRKKRGVKRSTKLSESEHIESENEEEMEVTVGVFKCPVCDAVFSRFIILHFQESYIKDYSGAPIFEWLKAQISNRGRLLPM